MTRLSDRLRTPEDWIEQQAHPLRSRRWWVAAVFLAVLVIGGTLVVVTGGRGQRPTPTRPAAPIDASPPSPARPAPAGCAGLGLPAGDTVIPQAGPAATWSRIGRVEAPSAAGIGPAGPGLGSCYAHTPAGALLAAANFLAWTTDPARVGTAITQLTADSPGREVLLDQLRTDPARVLGSGSGWQINAFTFLSATPATTAVTIVVRGGSGGFAAVPVTLVWNEEDATWQVALPDDGSLVARSAPLTTLDGYTVWQAG